MATTKKPVKAAATRQPPKKATRKQPPVRTPPPKTAPPKAPTFGPFGKAYLQNLKMATPGVTAGSTLVHTLRTATSAHLKAALAKSTPIERTHLFNAIPGDQVKSVLGSLPAGVFAPPRPASPTLLPAPTGGPPASILTTTYENVPYPPAQSDPLWSGKISSGSTIGITSPPPWEWVSVYDPRFEKEGSLNNPMAGVTGWAVHPELSQGDVWFVHPFGFDFEFYIVPDPQYEPLLAASNTGVTPGTGAVDSDYQAANDSAHAIGLAAPKGVLGVETDQGLMPPAFRNLITDGARVATFGRWIVDCGHEDFHTEIHAPLLMAVAKPEPPPVGRAGAGQMTHLEIMSRPYTVSQAFDEGNFIDHLLAEVAKVETTIFGIPMSTRVEAHPTIFRTPYDGRPFVKLLVQPPPSKHIGPVVTAIPHKLMVSYHFTHRAGVAVQVFNAGNGSVGIIIVLGDLNPAPLPPKHDLTVQWSQLGDKYSYVIDALQIIDILKLDIASAFILNRGILTDIYDPPSASSPLDNQNVAAPGGIEQLQPWAGLSEDDNQPFPIYGWLKVWWEQNPIVATTGSIASA